MLTRSKRRIKVETMKASKEAREDDMEEEDVEDMVGEEEYNSHVSIVVRYATWCGSVPSLAHCLDISAAWTMSWRIAQSCWKNGKKKRGVATWCL
jgi:hypothetical protein